MALEVINIKRNFSFEKNGKTIQLEDPSGDMSPEEVMKFYTSKHSELTNATVTGPKVDGNKAVYSFKTTVGTKG